MGVTHKLTAEIKEFIVEQKKSRQVLSCRNMSLLVKEKFQLNLSKSSINAIFKNSGLSMPVGRRLKKRRRRIIFPQMPVLEFKPETATEKPLPEAVKPITEQSPLPVLPVERQIIQVRQAAKIRASGLVFLQAADYLIGGRQYFFNLLKPYTSLSAEAFEELLYFSVEGQGAKSPYLNDLQQVKEINLGILAFLSTQLKPVRSLKISLEDGSSFYCDGQLRTLWPTPYSPYSFSTTICNIKSYIDKHYQQNLGFTLFMAPGSDSLPGEFLNFLMSFQPGNKQVAKISLLGSKLEEIEALSVQPTQQRYFVFGLWPWQYVRQRKVKQMGEFRPFRFAELKQEFYLADLEIELSQPIANKQLTLKGLALKTDPAGKVQLAILSNLSQQGVGLAELAKLYLERWPNLTEAFEDTSRKIELFNYTAEAEDFFSPGLLDPQPNKESKLEELLEYYLRFLDLYARWNFFPPEYEKTSFPSMKTGFYCLPASLQQKKNAQFLAFSPPQDPALLKSLQYACRRVNELEACLSDGQRLWLAV